MAAPSKDLLHYLKQWNRRLRLTLLPIWLPRGLIAGLLLGLLAALYARWRPSLSNEQVALLAALAVGMAVVVTLLAIFLHPRPAQKSARFFDARFALKDRTSTALEVAAGKITAPEPFASLQAQDALRVASQVKPGQHLPFSWRRRELVAALLLAVLLAANFLLANPQTTALAEKQAIEEAVEESVEALEEIKREVEANPALTEAQKAELEKLIDPAIERLKQPNISQPEAVAELKNTADQLSKKEESLTEAQKKAAALGAEALNESQPTQAAGKALENGDLGDAAKQLDSLAERMADGQLSPEQQADAAKALEKAAQALEGLNPNAAQALRDAAQALQQGDQKAASEAMKRAAEALQNQKDGLTNSPKSDAAKKASESVARNAEKVARAGSPSNGDSNQADSSQQSGEQGDSSSSSSSSSTESGSQSGGKSGEQAGSQGGGEGDSGEMFDPNNKSGAGNQAGGAPNGGQPGGQPGSQGGTSGQPGEGAGEAGQAGSTSGSGGLEKGPGTAGAGTGDGGAGNDVTSGNPNEAAADSSKSGPQGDKGLDSDGLIYAPSFVGGDGGEKMGLDGEGRPGDSDPLEMGDFTANPGGSTRVAIKDVAGIAAKQADEALENDRVPGALRGVVRDYFSGLQQ
jgi:hypothetical protein